MFFDKSLLVFKMLTVIFLLGLSVISNIIMRNGDLFVFEL